MPVVVGVTFRSAGQMHYYHPGEVELHEGDAVVAPTPRGMELGQVMLEPRELPAQELEPELRTVRRKATADDLRREEENRERERRAFEVCVERIHQHGLPMKLIEAHYTLDRARIVFYFSAEGRVDFRRLVRDLASELKTRVELHQVGVRDEAKLIGGFGPCGRPLCCATFLSSLQPVAIKMAKEQNLALNPLKISGVCGRLMCCLGYEYECYRAAKAELPRVGSQFTAPQGPGKVVEVNVIKQTVTVVLADGGRVEVEPHADANAAPPSSGSACGRDQSRPCGTCRGAGARQPPPPQAVEEARPAAAAASDAAASPRRPRRRRSRRPPRAGKQS